RRVQTLSAEPPVRSALAGQALSTRCCASSAADPRSVIRRRAPLAGADSTPGSALVRSPVQVCCSPAPLSSGPPIALCSAALRQMFARGGIDGLERTGRLRPDRIVLRLDLQPLG